MKTVWIVFEREWASKNWSSLFDGEMYFVVWTAKNKNGIPSGFRETWGSFLIDGGKTVLGSLDYNRSEWEPANVKLFLPLSLLLNKKEGD